MKTREKVRILSTICTRDESGKHFTEVVRNYKALEKNGLIAIDRQIHAETGISYDKQYWTVRLTEDGEAIVDAWPEYHA